MDPIWESAGILKKKWKYLLVPLFLFGTGIACTPPLDNPTGPVYFRMTPTPTLTPTPTN